MADEIGRLKQEKPGNEEEGCDGRRSYPEGGNREGVTGIREAGRPDPVADTCDCGGQDRQTG